MPRVCTICTHKSRAKIDQALVTRRPFRDIAGQYGVSKSALLAQVVDLRDKALDVLDTAQGSADLRAAIGAIREARGCVELLAKLAGQLKDAPTVNILVSSEWQGLQAVILQALEPHTDARLAVAEALTAVEYVSRT